jgi:hypothetical protein
MKLKTTAHLAIRMPALLAALTLLVMTTAGTAPGLFHGDDLDHCCEFCHIGHLPVLESVSGVNVVAPPELVLSVAAANAVDPYDHTYEFSLARAPPA